MSRAADHIVFVTGASSGFGAAIVRRLVAEGAKAIAVGRRADRLQALAAELGPAVLPLPLDVADRAAVEAAVAGLPADFAAITLLVNNAGMALGLEPAHRASLEDWETMIAVNCRGLVTVTRSLTPGMVARGRGHVVNIGSIAGTYPYPGGNVYGATKAFVHQFTLNSRSDLLGTPIRATCIEPGLCGGTEFSNVRFHGDDARATAVYDGADPLTAEDIAETVFWAATLPKHININTLEVMPTCQAPGALAIHRTP